MPKEGAKVSCLEFVKTPADQQGFDEALRFALGCSGEKQIATWNKFAGAYGGFEKIPNKELLGIIGESWGDFTGQCGSTTWNFNCIGGTKPRFWAHPDDVAPFVNFAPVTGTALCDAVRRAIWCQPKPRIKEVITVSEDAQEAFLERRRKAKAVAPVNVGDFIKYGQNGVALTSAPVRVVAVTKLNRFDSEGRVVYNISYSRELDAKKGDGPTASLFCFRLVGGRILSTQPTANNGCNWPHIKETLDELFIVGNVNDPKPEPVVVAKEPVVKTPMLAIGVPFEYEGRTWRVFESRGPNGEWGTTAETMPKDSQNFRAKEIRTAYPLTQFGFLPVKRKRAADDGLGPLLRGDVVTVPYTYHAVPAGKDPKKNPGVPERVIEHDDIILGCYDMRYSISKQLVGTPPFLLNIFHGSPRAKIEAVRLEKLGFTVDWELLGDPIPWDDLTKSWNKSNPNPEPVNQPNSAATLPPVPIVAPSVPPSDKPATLPDVAGATALHSFGFWVRASGYHNRVTTGDKVCAQKAARACNALLGRPASDHPQPTTDEWKQAAEMLRARSMDNSAPQKIPELEALPIEAKD